MAKIIFSPYVRKIGPEQGQLRQIPGSSQEKLLVILQGAEDCPDEWIKDAYRPSDENAFEKQPEYRIDYTLTHMKNSSTLIQLSLSSSASEGLLSLLMREPE